MLKSIIKPG